MISIIAPVYNVEKYIRRCIDSIIGQTYKDWELLLVDDGSPDKSADICDKYALKDPRIKVFHKVNGGVSSARNLGLAEATGEYITFIDTDDWFDCHCLDICNKEIHSNNLDVFQFRCKKVNSSGIVIRYDKRGNTNVCDPEGFIEECMNFGLQYTVWCSVIRTSILKENHICFDERMAYNEDNKFFLEAMLASARIKASDVILYNYFDNDQGAMKNYRFDKLFVSDYLFCKFLQDKPLLRWMYIQKVFAMATFWSDKKITSFESDRLQKAWAEYDKTFDFNEIRGKKLKCYYLLSIISLRLANAWLLLMNKIMNSLHPKNSIS